VVLNPHDGVDSEAQATGQQLLSTLRTNSGNVRKIFFLLLFFSLFFFIIIA
jgi:hypothetical protein